MDRFAWLGAAFVTLTVVVACTSKDSGSVGEPDVLPPSTALCYSGEPLRVSEANPLGMEGYWIYSNDKKTPQETEDMFMKPGSGFFMAGVTGTSVTIFSASDSGDNKGGASCVQAIPLDLEILSPTEANAKPSQAMIRHAQAQRDYKALKNIEEAAPIRVRLSAGKLEVHGKDEKKADKVLLSMQRIASSKALAKLGIEQGLARKNNDFHRAFIKKWKGKKLELVKQYYSSGGDGKRTEYDPNVSDTNDTTNSKGETVKYPNPKTMELVKAGLFKVNGTYDVGYRVAPDEKGEAKLEVRYEYEEDRTIHIMSGVPRERPDGLVEFANDYTTTDSAGNVTKHESGWVYKIQ